MARVSEVRTETLAAEEELKVQSVKITLDLVRIYGEWYCSIV